jgi:hypothetical protein
MAISFPASAVGGETTFTTTTSVFEHPDALTVTVYVVVDAGLATGFEIVVELKPAPGLQEYDVPPLADNVVEAPLQIVTSVPALAAGKGVTVTVITSVAAHPPPVTVTV